MADVICNTSMIYTEHKDAESFLVVARPALEHQECANSLMLGYVKVAEVVDVHFQNREDNHQVQPSL